MKKISVLLGLLALLCANLAFAAGAIVTSLNGTAQAQTGSAAPRTLREGDTVNQGDTVFTGGGSSLVLRFDDGQVAALTSNSRMTVTTYDYNSSSGGGNVFLSLITGGMRTITGLIGHRNPSNVAFRAATATIGIRGTDVTFATQGNEVLVEVTDGSVTVTVGTQTITLAAGEAAFIRPGPNGIPVIVKGPIATVLNGTGQNRVPEALQRDLSSATGVTLSTVGQTTSTTTPNNTQVTITNTSGGGSSVH
jgi:hypothetical protein